MSQYNKDYTYAIVTSGPKEGTLLIYISPPNEFPENVKQINEEERLVRRFFYFSDNSSIVEVSATGRRNISNWENLKYKFRLLIARISLLISPDRTRRIVSPALSSDAKQE
jgi:hypothetical protein